MSFTVCGLLVFLKIKNKQKPPNPPIKSKHNKIEEAIVTTQAFVINILKFRKRKNHCLK